MKTHPLPGATGSAFPYSTVALPDGIVIGGPWPQTIISWPGGKSRGATKPEYDLFQALEKAHAEIEAMRANNQAYPTAAEREVERKQDNRI